MSSASPGDWEKHAPLDKKKRRAQKASGFNLTPPNVRVCFKENVQNKSRREERPRPTVSPLAKLKHKRCYTRAQVSGPKKGRLNGVAPVTLA